MAFLSVECRLTIITLLKHLSWNAVAFYVNFYCFYEILYQFRIELGIKWMIEKNFWQFLKIDLNCYSLNLAGKVLGSIEKFVFQKENKSVGVKLSKNVLFRSRIKFILKIMMHSEYILGPFNHILHWKKICRIWKINEKIVKIFKKLNSCLMELIDKRSNPWIKKRRENRKLF